MKEISHTNISSPLLSEEKDDEHRPLPYFRIILCQVVACLCIFLMRLSVKIGTSEYGVSVNEFLFVRGAIIISIALFVFPTTGHKLSEVLATSWKTLLVRMVSGFSANMFFNYSITKIDLSLASTLFNTYPIFAVLIGVFFFKEEVTKLQVVALLSTFAGVLLLTTPCVFTFSCESDRPLNIYVILPLFGSISAAVAMAGIRNCKKFHWIVPSAALGVSFFVVSPILTILLGGFAPFDPIATLLMISSGLCGAGINFAIATGLRMGNLSFNTPLGYLSVVFSTLGDLFFFHVDITWSQYIGSIVIFIGIVCTTVVKYTRDQEKKLLKDQQL